MNDDVITDLDRRIEEALAVEPSPDFQARVRIRLSEESPRYPVGMGWLVYGGVALTGLALLALFVSSRGEVGPRAAAPVAPTAAVSESMPAPTTVAPPVTRPMPVAVPPDAASTVLVPAAERAAFRRFLQTVAENGLSYSIVADASDDAPLSVPELTIEPIVTMPIDSSAE